MMDEYLVSLTVGIFIFPLVFYEIVKEIIEMGYKNWKLKYED